MELRQLRYFVTVARSGNFRRASDLLHMTQPALSRQIQKLEWELGAPLFVRRPQGVVLTPNAERFMLRAQSLLDDAEALSKDFSAATGREKTTVSVSVSPGTSEIVTAPLSRMLAERHPEILLRLVPALMTERRRLLLQGKVAFAVMNAPPNLPGITLTPLMREPLCLIARSDDDRFGPDAVSLEDIVGIPLVLGGLPESGVRGLLEAAVARIGRSITPIVEVSTAGASKPLVIAGVGPTVHVAAMAREEIESGVLKAVPIRDLYSCRVLALATGAIPAPAVLSVIRAVRDCLAQLIEEGVWRGGEMAD